MMKQIIIARKDLHMSAGKLAAQVSHASEAFIYSAINQNARLKENDYYEAYVLINKAIYEEWICGAFTKVVLEARNKNHLLKAIEMAKQHGLYEDEDFFPIYDNCCTELTPEEPNGTTLTCIGFSPLPDSIIDPIGKKYQLYRG